jgi:parallel beta-helix repeat protein
MTKKLLLLFLLILIKSNSFAQYTTPNTGVNWTLADLAANAPAAVTFTAGVYTISQDITIAENDALAINVAGTIVKLNAGVLITVAGDFISDAANITITATDITQPYEGFRFEETSSGFFRNTTVTYGGGMRVMTGNFTMDQCTVSYHNSGAATGSAISFSTGSPIVSNSVFKFNQLPAFSSGANQYVSASFLNNYLEGNNKANSNRPQINMGPSGNDTIRIVGNTIKGDRLLTLVGGIAVANLLGSGTSRVIIDNNIITDNRYGITVVGGTSSGYIRNNIIENNNTQNNPAQGGSGISLSAAGPGMNIIASNNQIRGNLWGITLITQAGINLGNTDPANFNPGGNIFANNGNGGQTYALFNNTPNTVFAMNNCWIEGTDPTATEVENVISHQADNPALGLVNYTPYGCTLGTPEFAAVEPLIYPNPSNGNFSIYLEEQGKAAIYTVSGQMIAERALIAGENNLHLELPAGVYFIRCTVDGKPHNNKVVIK